MARESFNFSNPPIWEVGFSATTKPGMYDPFEVATLHKIFSEELPVVQHQSPFAGLDPFPAGAVIGPQFTINSADDQRSRWWFSSEDQADLLQIQEDFVARNWRRVALPPATGRHYYGYEARKTAFIDQIERLTKWHAQRGAIIPDPVRCELLYDNLILFDDSKSPWLLRDALTVTQFSDLSGLKGHFSMNWLDSVGWLGVGSGIQVFIALVGAQPTTDEAPRRFLKLQFSARADCSSWPDAYAFFDKAHSRIRELLADLTTTDLRATWGS